MNQIAHTSFRLARTAIPAKLEVDGVTLSRAMSTILMEHANGPRSVINAEKRTIQALQRKGLIYLNRVHRPTRTVVTQRGRKVIAELTRIRGKNGG